MRAWNFCAGPAAIPEEVLKEVQEELLEWNDAKSSVMEVSHRSDFFQEVASESKKDFIELLNIPENYDVLFLLGGATQQFAMIPLNFVKNGKANYLMTGTWSKKAIAAASKYLEITIPISNEDNKFTSIPENFSKWSEFNLDADYSHYCANETIQGFSLRNFHKDYTHKLNMRTVPLLCDMSSSILSEPFEVADFDLIYAGAQKNIGPAGLTIIIIEKNLFSKINSNLPDIFNYEKHANANSMLNTPPTFAWYLSGKVFKWLKEKGGLAAMQKINEEKAKTLYQFIDQSSMYSNLVESNFRSIMNIPFLLKDPAFDRLFLENANKAGLLNLKGHRSVGGMRASIYNATPIEAVNDLIDFMDDFEKNNL